MWSRASNVWCWSRGTPETDIMEKHQIFFEISPWKVYIGWKLSYAYRLPVALLKGYLRNDEIERICAQLVNTMRKLIKRVWKKDWTDYCFIK